MMTDLQDRRLDDGFFCFRISRAAWWHGFPGLRDPFRYTHRSTSCLQFFSTPITVMKTCPPNSWVFFLSILPFLLVFLYYLLPPEKCLIDCQTENFILVPPQSMMCPNFTAEHFLENFEIEPEPRQVRGHIKLPYICLPSTNCLFLICCFWRISVHFWYLIDLISVN